MIKKNLFFVRRGLFSDPVRIQTWNLLIRSQILYSVELRGQRGAKIINYCLNYISSLDLISYYYQNPHSLAYCKQINEMKIYFWSVGKAHDPYVREGIELFTKRISHYYPVEWKILSPAKNTASSIEEEIKKAEATTLLNALQNDDVLVALDENGKQWNSPELAGYIQRKANESARNIIFLIGGAYGLHESILKRCNHQWSLSKLVFPHQLVRLILTEQVYRACTIIRNEKYHHS